MTTFEQGVSSPLGDMLDAALAANGETRHDIEASSLADEQLNQPQPVWDPLPRILVRTRRSVYSNIGNRLIGRRPR